MEVENLRMTVVEGSQPTSLVADLREDERRAEFLPAVAVACDEVLPCPWTVVALEAAAAVLASAWGCSTSPHYC
jgi:hypothetical protein